MTDSVRISLAEDTPVGTRIVEAVATLIDTSPPAMTPFYDSVDPDVFDTLFRDGSGECCQFVYDGMRIQLRRVDDQTLQVAIRDHDDSV